VVSDRILTVPNAFSFLRLLGVPLFLYLVLVPQYDGWALIVLVVSAITDYADGKLARLLNQYSRLGELLDPAADRLYILAALVAFVIRGFIPWWVAALIIGRDVLLAATLPVLRLYRAARALSRQGRHVLPVLRPADAAAGAAGRLDRRGGPTDQLRVHRVGAGDVPVGRGDLFPPTRLDHQELPARAAVPAPGRWDQRWLRSGGTRCRRCSSR
jgi:phosphatidylglycerophosphate synthase